GDEADLDRLRGGRAGGESGAEKRDPDGANSCAHGDLLHWGENPKGREDSNIIRRARREPPPGWARRAAGRPALPAGGPTPGPRGPARRAARRRRPRGPCERSCPSPTRPWTGCRPRRRTAPATGTSSPTPRWGRRRSRSARTSPATAAPAIRTA